MADPGASSPGTPDAPSKTSDDQAKGPDVATASAAAANAAYAGEAAGDLPLHEQHIRDQGMSVDLPFEAPGPADLKYKDTGQQGWEPPPGFRLGMPPIDPDVALTLGVPRDLGDSNAQLQEAEVVGIVFDPVKHPRGWHGHFAEVLGQLPKPSLRGRGGHVAIPGAHTVTRTRHGFEVAHEGKATRSFATAHEAAKHVHGEYESARLHAETQAELEAERAQRAQRQASSAAESASQTAMRTWYRFESPDTAHRIAQSGEVWGLPGYQGRGISAVRAQPRRPDASTIARERAAGRTLVEFHTKARPDDNIGVPHFAWTPGSPAQAHHELERAHSGQTSSELRLEHETTALGRVPVAKLRVHDVHIITS